VPTPAPRHRGRPRDAATEAGSRQRLFAAAAAEFAARGFAGASVDRIARAAHVNKAMIYYHFRSKAALYREIVGDMFRAVAARVRAVADSDAAPRDKLQQFVAAIAIEAEARPHFPPTWFREIAEGGVHLDGATLREIAGIVQVLARILEQGARKRQFRRVNPMLVHGGIIAPLLLFFASGPVRARLQQAGVAGIGDLTREAVVAHVQRVTLDLVEGRT
jgi:TetR/AcrR family transcriptional regulator